MSKRAALSLLSMALDGAAFAGAVLVIGAWCFGLLPAILGGR